MSVLVRVREAFPWTTMVMVYEDHHADRQVPEKKPGHVVWEIGARYPNPLVRQQVGQGVNWGIAEFKPLSLFRCNTGTLTHSLHRVSRLRQIVKRRSAAGLLSKQVFELRSLAANLDTPGNFILNGWFALERVRHTMKGKDGIIFGGLRDSSVGEKLRDRTSVEIGEQRKFER